MGAAVVKMSEDVSAPEWDRMETMVDVKNVTVAYRSYTQRPTSMKETFLKFLKTGSFKSYSTFDALCNVSF